MPIHRLLPVVAAAAIASGCTGVLGATEAFIGGPFRAAGLPPMKGQVATCTGPREKTFNLEAREETVDLGMGIKLAAWTYNGGLPGPVLEACEGDTVTIVMTNHAEAFHGLDSHAFRSDTMHFGPVEPGKAMRMQKTVDTSGVFMYHCAVGPSTDYHVKSGLAGPMIVYPRNRLLRRARELVVVETAVYGERDASGEIPGTDPELARKNEPSIMMFNGRLSHEPLSVEPGDLVRAYIVNVGPGTSAIHVMGTILDTVTDGASVVRNVQTYGVPAGGGAIVEFRIPEPGMYGLVDHDRLAYLPYGMVIPFVTAGHDQNGTK
jgi:nitrite reductase (NO-forming)